MEQTKTTDTVRASALKGFFLTVCKYECCDLLLVVTTTQLEKDHFGMHV